MLNQPDDHLWHQLTEAILTGMHKWRQQHPTATLRQIAATNLVAALTGQSAPNPVNPEVLQQ